MGEQPPQERNIGELCTPDIVDLPNLNLAEIRRSFEIKTLTICMVQHSPFIGKEDSNLHLQAFIQLCQTFNMDGVTQESRSNEGKALFVLATREGFAIVPCSTGGDGAKLERIDERLHEGILLTG
jgi:hypothetical protein